MHAGQCAVGRSYLGGELALDGVAVAHGQRGSLLVSFLKPEKPSYQLAGLLGPRAFPPWPTADTTPSDC